VMGKLSLLLYTKAQTPSQSFNRNHYTRSFGAQARMGTRVMDGGGPLHHTRRQVGRKPTTRWGMKPHCDTGSSCGEPRH